MKKSQGAVRAKGTCPRCGEKFSEVKGIGYICLEHETVPKKLYVDLPWKGRRIRIFSDKTGHVLDTYDRAEEVLKTLHYEIRNHIFDPNKYIKAEASKFWAANLLERFEKEKIDNIAPKYKTTYRQSIRVAKEFFKIQDVREIRKLDITDYVKDCRKRYPKWSDKTLKNHVDVFKTFMNYLHRDLELISTVPPFPAIDYVEKTFKWVSGEDQIKLYEMVPDRHKAIIAFLMLHGCRPGEARALKCKDVDLEHACITIAATFSKNVYRLRRKGKRARPYIIPIHAEMYEYIMDRVKNSHPESFLFPNPNTGRFYGESVLPKIWKVVRDQAGIGPFELRLYDASRHSFASQLANSGTTLFFVSKALGHSTPKMSERYSHADLEKLRTNLSAISLTNRRTVTILSPRKNSGIK
jgi:integrase